MINKTLIIGINLGDFGSTGTIMRNSLEYAYEHGSFDYLVIVPCNQGNPNTFSYLDGFSISFINKVKKHFVSKFFDKPDGFYDKNATSRIVKKIKEKCEEYEKVIVHIHNIHMANIDFRTLFKYLSKEDKIKKVFYTLHDCWSFTGGCYWFEKEGCLKWKNGCKGECIKHCGGKCFSTAKILSLKIKYTNLLKDKITLIPVSKWCDNLLKQSMLKELPSKVIEGECNIVPLKNKDILFKESLGIEKKYKVLLIIDGWKGYSLLDKFIDNIPDGYKLILINGHRNNIHSDKLLKFDKVDNRLLPLFFSITDCFVSITQEDNLPLTIMEAQMCGVPVVGFGNGGTPEEIIEGVTGIMNTKKNDIDELIANILKIDELKFSKQEIVKNGMRFSKYSCAKKMLDLYEKV